MVKLLIIADDLTGALDTGVQFAERGIETKITTDVDIELNHISESVEVLIVDTETRPLTSEQAYKVVRLIAENAIEYGIKTILKKTDSALRGNIGSELQALSDAGNREVHFIPAFPDTRRVTKKGTHYIDGKEIHLSPFGRDPFEPVTESYIPKLIQGQSSIDVEVVAVNEVMLRYFEQRKVVLYDALANEHIKTILQEVYREGDTLLLAGCAGLATQLRHIIDFDKSLVPRSLNVKGLLVVSGSMNPITKRQIQFAHGSGFTYYNLKPHQKIDPEYWNSKESVFFLNALKEDLSIGKSVIVDGNDSCDNASAIYAKQNDISESDVRYRVASNLGKLIHKMIQFKMEFCFLMTGGDTMMGLMKEVGHPQLDIIREIDQGSVLSEIKLNGHSVQVISKSGGLGAEDTFVKIAKRITEIERGEV